MLSENEIASRLAAIEAHLTQETGQRIRDGHEFRHRLYRVEQIALLPALARRISGPILWPWRSLQLDFRRGLGHAVQRLLSSLFRLARQTGR